MAYTNTTFHIDGPYVINNRTTARIVIKTDARLNHLILSQDDDVRQGRRRLKLYQPAIECLRRSWADVERELVTFRSFALSLGDNRHLVIHRCVRREERRLSEEQIEELYRYPGVKYQHPYSNVWGALFVQTPTPSTSVDFNSAILPHTFITFSRSDFYYLMTGVDSLLRRLARTIPIPHESPLMQFYKWYYAPDDTSCSQLFASIDHAREALEDYIDSNQLYHHDLEKYRIINISLPRIDKDDICKYVIFKACLERLDESCAGHLPAEPQIIDTQLSTLNVSAIYMTLVDTLHGLKYSLFHVPKSHVAGMINSRAEDSVFDQLCRAPSVSASFKYLDTLQTAMYEALLEAIWRDFAKRFAGVETDPDRPIML